MIKLLAAIGSLILVVTAVYHLTATGDAVDAMAPIEASFFKSGLTGMWVLPGIHWIFFAALAFSLSFYKSNAGSIVLVSIGVWVLIDAVITFRYVGAFIGVYMLAAAGLCILASGLLLRRSMKR